MAIYSQDWDQHLTHIKTALTLLKERGLTAKIGKCKFARRSVEFLGHVVGGGRLGVQKAKVQAILDMPVPETKKKLMSFLGSTGYYRRFIPNYSGMAAKLSDLTKKALPDKLAWSPVHQEAFDRLKQALSEAPVLTAPNPNLPYILSTDASGVGIGAVLEQQQGDQVKPIAYYSRKLADRETRYDITELEALAIHQAVRHFAIYLLGNKTRIFTDHRALTFLRTMRNSSPRVARWWVELQQYDLEIYYKKGAENVVADTLSRNLDTVDPLDDQVHSLEGGGGVGAKSSVTHGKCRSRKQEAQNVPEQETPPTD